MRPVQAQRGEPLRVDARNACVWRGAEAIRLPPKAVAFLQYLMAHAGQVVTKDELFTAVWPETVVSEGTLTECLRALRQALRDAAQAPQYIETVHRRGYRFIGPVPGPGAGGPPPDPAAMQGLGAEPPALGPRWVVGREAAVAQLHGWLAQARRGVRQVGFVTGEPGIGKTTVVEAFCAQAARAAPLWLAQGQCLDHYGAGEAYLPVFDALGRLCRGPGGAQLVAVLRQQAPTWLGQMPALLGAAEREAVQRRGLGATRERMLRELGEALEGLTRTRLLVLVLEDLHWSDAATLDLLAWLAQRREPAQLLLLGTYRPVEVIVRGHPLRRLTQTLTLHGQAVELPLELLTPAAVAQYLTARFGSPAVAALAVGLHRRTTGNPLSLVTLVDAWVR